MDINNSQNTNQIIYNIIISCIVIKLIFKKDNIDFRFKLTTWDNVEQKNIKSILGNKSRNQECNYRRSN